MGAAGVRGSMLHCHALLQLLSKKKLLAHVLRTLDADLAMKIQLQAEWQDISAKLAKQNAQSHLHQA